MINLKKILLYRIVPALPIMQLVMSVWAAIGQLTWFNAGDTIGYSITTGIVYFAFFYYKYDGKHAYVFWISSIGLIIMNLFSWLGSLIYYGEYGLVYDVGIFVTFIWIVLLVYLKKRRRDRDYITVHTPK